MMSSQIRAFRYLSISLRNAFQALSRGIVEVGYAALVDDQAKLTLISVPVLSLLHVWVQ